MSRFLTAPELASLKQQFFDSLSGRDLELLAARLNADVSALTPAVEAAQASADDAHAEATAARFVADAAVKQADARALDFSGSPSVLVPRPDAPEGAANRRYVDASVAGLASGGDVSAAIAPLATKDELSAAVAPLASAASVVPLAPRSYVDAAVAPLASRTYVDEKFAEGGTEDVVVASVTPGNQVTLKFVGGLFIESVDEVIPAP